LTKLSKISGLPHQENFLFSHQPAILSGKEDSRQRRGDRCRATGSLFAVDHQSIDPAGVRLDKIHNLLGLQLRKQFVLAKLRVGAVAIREAELHDRDPLSRTELRPLSIEIGDLYSGPRAKAGEFLSSKAAKRKNLLHIFPSVSANIITDESSEWSR